MAREAELTDGRQTEHGVFPSPKVNRKPQTFAVDVARESQRFPHIAPRRIRLHGAQAAACPCLGQNVCHQLPIQPLRSAKNVAGWFQSERVRLPTDDCCAA